jgi:hypothetical protein
MGIQVPPDARVERCGLVLGKNIHQLVGEWEQSPGRGFSPRFSAGTLQLFKRWSSVHFSPRRSFPVFVEA